MKEKISIILNVYNRSYLLKEQINSLLNQSVKININDINIWVNDNGRGKQNLNLDKNIKVYKCNWNTKFWGRFTIPLLLEPGYIAMFDDDTIPNSDWIKNCLDTINTKETNGILGGAGIILRKKSYKPVQRVGWNGVHSDKTIRVDLVGHAWFFRQEWAKYIWYEKPYTWDNGEDIMFSYLAQKYGNINTFVPPHPENNKDLWSTDFNKGAKYGGDENASFKLNKHYSDRDNVCIYCINNGWKTVNNII